MFNSREKQENNSPTRNKGRIIILPSSLSSMATTAPSEKEEKYSIKDKNKQQKDKTY